LGSLQRCCRHSPACGCASLWGQRRSRRRSWCSWCCVVSCAQLRRRAAWCGGWWWWRCTRAELLAPWSVLAWVAPSSV
jgi:hypothetical protein